MITSSTFAAVFDATGRDFTVEHAKVIENILGEFPRFLAQLEEFQRLTDCLNHGKPLTAVIGILVHTRRICFYLIEGYTTQDLSLCAWGGRSLVELWIWNRYIWSGQENAKRFYDDSIIDQHQLHTVVLNHLRKAGYEDSRDAKSEQPR